MKRHWRLALTYMLLLGIGCSEDPAAPKDPGGTPIGTGTQTTTINPGGGSIAAKTKEGAIATLTFPAGAVQVPTSITIRPEDPEPGAWLNIALEPAFMVFFSEVTLKVDVPDGVTVDSDLALIIGSQATPTLLPSAVDVGARTVTTTLYGFGISTSDDYGTLPEKPSATGAAENSNNVGGTSITCTQHVAIAEAAFNSFVNLGTYEKAIDAALAAAACLMKDDCPGAETWIDAASQTACAQLADAVLNAQAVATEDFGILDQTLSPMLYWAGIVQKLDPSCEALSDALTQIDAELAEFVTFYNAEAVALPAENFTKFHDLKDEARKLHKRYSEALYLGAQSAADDIKSKAFDPVLNKLRDVAYTLCRDDDWHYPLTRMTSAGFSAGRDVIGQPPKIGEGTSTVFGPFTDADIWDDIQYCGSSVDIKSIVTSGTEHAMVHVGGGVSDGTETSDGMVETPTRGKIRIEGEWAAFIGWAEPRCDDEIVVAIDNADVLTIRREVGSDDYINANPGEFDIKAAITQAAGTPAKDGESFAMTIRRKQPNCDARLWGPAEYTLFAVTLKMLGPDLSIEDNVPSTVTPGQQVPVQIKVGIVDQAGETTHEEGVDVSVNVTGGTADPPSGPTDSDGHFNTIIIIDDETTGEKTSALADVSVEVTADTDGVSKKKTITATTGLNEIRVCTQNELDAHAGSVRVETMFIGLNCDPRSDIADLSPLNQLEEVITNTAILQSLDVTNLQQLASLRTVPSMRITDLPFISNLEGLESMRFTVGGMTIADCPMLATLFGLQFNTGNINVHRSGIIDLDGLGHLFSSLGIQVTNCDNFESTQGLATLNDLGTLRLVNNNAMTEVTLPPAVTSLLAFELLTCHAVVDLDGLSNITAVNGQVTINGNSKLASISGLFGITSISGNLTVTNNAALDIGAVTDWANNITIGGTVTIHQ